MLWGYWFWEVSDVFRLLDYLIGGLALLALPLLLWWGIYQSPQSAVNLQARLEARAAAALTESGNDWARVSMDGQRAVLTGAAPSHDAITEAARAVRRSSGPGGIVLGGVTQVESRTDAAPPISPYVWRARKTAEGRIELSGHVPTKAIQASLIEEARLVGRAAVDDQMKPAPGVPSGNFQGIARFALTQLSQLDEGEVTISDYRVILKGSVADPAKRAEVLSAMSKIAGPFRGEPLLTGEMHWQASLAGGVLSLSGSVQNEAERRQVLAVVENAGFEGEIVDGMTLGPAPEEGWLAGALAGLPQFTQFDEGVMAFDAAGGVFRFEGAARASTLHFLQEDMAREAAAWKTVMAAEVAGNVTAMAGLVMPASADGAPLACQDDLAAVLAGGGIRFAEGGARIARESGPALDQIAGILLSCDTADRFEVIAPGSVQASELADFLVLAGVARARLAAISYGSEPGTEATQSAEDGGDRVRPVDIRIVERSRQ